jgi:hypothetical protein
MHILSGESVRSARSLSPMSPSLGEGDGSAEEAAAAKAGVAVAAKAGAAKAGVAAAAKAGVAATADFREGRCGCGFCRHSHGPAVCWSVPMRVAAEVAEAEMAEAEMAEAEMAEAEVAAVMAVVMGAAVTRAAVTRAAVTGEATALAGAPERHSVSTPAA